ncbi:MAG: PAS domain S-box protein [Thiohalocapsa sp.]|nr:PAS domain S-box protein [Thiohalocapsa sp.]
MDETYADLVHYQVELEQKNSELEDAQGFLASVLSSMTDVLIACDVQGRIQQVNQALEELVGRTEAELKGTSFLSLMAPPSRSLAEGFAEQIRRGAVHDCEVTLLCDNGDDAPLAMNCTSRYDHRGRLVGMVLIGRPVGDLREAYRALEFAYTELKRAQTRLIGAEKMASLGRLVAGVAHELNNPISFVYGNVHALARYRERLQTYCKAVDASNPPPDLLALKQDLRIEKLLHDLDPLLKGTLEGAERVRDLVQDLRRFSSGQQGELAELDLVHVLRTAEHWVTKSARRDLTVVFDVPESLIVTGHSGQLQQVMMNLIQNALDAMQEVAEPRLEIAAGRDDETAWVTVRDTGPGIAPADLQKVLDPFFTTKPVGKGTGLGLSISYGIVRDHGGQIHVDNHADGGAVARVQLPLQSAAVDAPTTGPAPDASTPAVSPGSGPGAGRAGSADERNGGQRR